MLLLRILLATLLAVGLCVPVVLACTCVGSSPLESLSHSDVVFVGTVLSREEPPPQYVVINGQPVQVISGGDLIRYRIIASRGWKGAPFRTVSVYSARDGAACGYEFQVGEQYLIYAYWAQAEDVTYWGPWPDHTTFPALLTHLCLRTQPLSRADYDLAALGTPSWTRAAGPAAVRLDQNRPNPFNPTTSIGFELTIPSRATLRVFDAAGRVVRTLVDREMPAGSYTYSWDGRDEDGRSATSGVYFYELKSGSAGERRRMVLVR